MAQLKVEIEFESETNTLQKKVDGEKVDLSKAEILSFCEGELGDVYLNLLVPHDGSHMELHANRQDMAKKNGMFELTELPNGGLKVKVKGVFKVDAYKHVQERIEEGNLPFYISGIYAGDWPPIGGDFKGYDKTTNNSSLVAKKV